MLNDRRFILVGIFIGFFLVTVELMMFNRSWKLEPTEFSSIQYLIIIVGSTIGSGLFFKFPKPINYLLCIRGYLIFAAILVFYPGLYSIKNQVTFVNLHKFTGLTAIMYGFCYIATGFLLILLSFKKKFNP